MAQKTQAPGCRNAATATTLLLSLAVTFMATGLALVNAQGCSGLCETAALTLLYAGGPIGAVMGVVFEDIFVVWPLEITMWVVIAFLLAKRADTRKKGVLGSALLVVGAALVYGLVLSRLVEIAV